MIYIRVDQGQIPADWLDRANLLTEELRQLQTPEERKEFIRRHAGFWSAIKDQLRQISHGKCWYTEAPDCVSDWHVDHYRPKSRAIELDGSEHEGYTWLAFDWRNFRLCGSYPNSAHKDEFGEVRGKRDLFPLMPGCRRACWADQNCEAERPLLLDPTNPHDPNLITFDNECLVACARKSNRVAQLRVRVTSKILYLDYPSLVEARKRVWRECEELIEDLENLATLEPEQINDQTKGLMASLERRLREKTMPSSPFSSVARACLRINEYWDLISTPEMANAA